MGTSKRHSYSETINSFFNRCEKLTREMQRDWCCLAIDIEHFKLFNEMYGMEMGDQLLSSIHDDFVKLETEIDCVSAYQGNDDFVIFMNYDLERIRQIYTRIRDIIAKLCNTTGFLPAIGIYRLEKEETVSLTMCDKAVSAMIDAKKNHKQRIREFDLEAYEREQKERQLLIDLRKAVQEDQITFYLQPQCNIVAGKIVGAEALMRWILPDGRMVSPAVFVPILEKNNFIADFDRLIWEKVCIWISSLLDRGIRPIPISINVSQMDILTMDVVAVLDALCEKYEIPTQFLKIEITESSYAETYERVQSFSEELKNRGFIVMMDDFGSGYSSLNMLESVAVDVLKLDMVFMKNNSIYSRKGVALIESIINMAKRMGLSIVVEGVETQEQIEFLKRLGCRYAQGYYYYKPMSVPEFEKMMLTGDSLDYDGLVDKMNEEFHVREFLDENTFTDTMLNHILGAVAIYALDGKDLTIIRFNELFYEAISDDSMETRQEAIQHYVVKEDWPSLYRALDDACKRPNDGGTCEVRFYKSDNSIFWFRMHFYYLRNEGEKKIFYGQVLDVTEVREQSIQFFEVLRERSDLCMVINLERKNVQYVTGFHTLSQIGLPTVDLGESVRKTVENRIDGAEDKERFRRFFDSNRLVETHNKAIYHESLLINFRMEPGQEAELVEFSTYYIRYSKEQELNVFVFITRVNKKN